MSSASRETTSLEIGHYVAVLKRRWWVVVIFAVVGGLLGAAYLATANRQVTATTVVNLNVISSDPFNAQRSPADMINADTEVQLATSSPVLGDVASTLGSGTTASHVRGNTTVTVVPATTVVKVSYTDNSVSAAERGADSVADAYLTYRGQQASDRVSTIIDQLRKREDSLRTDLVRINTIARGASPGSGRALQAESDRQLATIELDSLAGQINTFLGLDTTGGSVLSKASENPTKISPSRGLVIGTGVLLGILLGALAAFVLGAIDRKVRDDYDVRRLGGGRVLGELSSKRGEIPASGQDADTIGTVRELLFATLPEAAPTVALADLSGGEAGPDVATNLAYSVTETGTPVRLVLQDYDPASIETITRSLDLLPSARASNGSDSFENELMTLMTLHGKGIATVPPAKEGVMTIIGLPAGAAQSSLLAAGRRGHAVVLVVAKGGTTRAAVRRATEELPTLGAEVHGTVLVPRRRKPAKTPRGA